MLLLAGLASLLATASAQESASMQKFLNHFYNLQVTNVVGGMQILLSRIAPSFLPLGMYNLFDSSREMTSH
jgi:ATP/ADP translocase